MRISDWSSDVCSSDLGIGTIPAIITAFIISFFPIVVNVATGLATIEPELRDVLRSLGATKTEILMKVGLPLINTILLVSSSFTLTWAHHALRKNNRALLHWP